MEWFCYKVWYMTILLMVLRKVRLDMKATQCAGAMFSLTCGSNDYVIHILYEKYSYKPNQDSLGLCVYDSSHCSGVEFIDPFSTNYCNGYSQCSFLVPTEHRLTACNKTVTEVTVLYNCIARNQMIDISKPFSSRNEQLVYFKSTDYPSKPFKPTKCFCNITGQNITAEIYEHEKSKNSSVVFMFVTNEMTIHVNDVEIRNRILFSEMDHIQLIVDNRKYQELFKLWMKVTGKEMVITCQSHSVEIKPSSTTHYTTTDFNSNHQTHHIESSISFLSEQIKISTTEFTSTIYYKSSNQKTPPLSTNQNINSTLQVEPLIVQTSSLSHSITSTPIMSTTSSNFLTLSSSIGNGQNNRTKEEEIIIDADQQPIIIIACALGTIIIISVVLGIFIYKRKHKDDDIGYSTDDSEGEIYHAYRF